MEEPAPEPTPVRATVRTFTPPAMPAPKRIDDGPAVVLDASTILPGATEIKPVVVLPEMNAPPPPEPTPSQPPRQVRIGGQIQAANLIKRVAPIYPPLARTTHVQGTVQFTAVIGKDGHVKNVKYVSGPQILAQAGKDAVSHWVYKPMLLDGQPTEVVTEIDVVFNLQ
jgi:protein TonB